MDLTVFLAVLAAAAMHAAWNAFVKGGGDPFAALAQMSILSGAVALVGVMLVPVPAAPVWPWLVASWLLHTLYRAFLTLTYRAGDLSQVYPIARGSAPLLTALGSALLLGEHLGLVAYGGMLMLVAGVFLLGLKGGRGPSLEKAAVGYALLTACCIAGYTIVDGQGARLNGSAVGFILWESLGNSMIMAATTLRLRGLSVYLTPPQPWPVAAVAAALSLFGYMIAAWAMTRAPIALVAALRETSVLFAAAIAALVLKEPVTAWRIRAAVMVVAGLVLLRLA